MSGRKQKIICYALAFIMLFTGLVYENMKPASRAACTPIEDSVSYINSSCTRISQTDICPVERLGVRDNSYIQQFTNRHICNRRDVRISLLFLCINIFTQSLISLSAIEYVIQLAKSHYKTAIINYIHNADGKKRI